MGGESLVGRVGHAAVDEPRDVADEGRALGVVAVGFLPRDGEYPFGVHPRVEGDAYPDRGGEWDDLDAGEAMLRMQVTGTVGRALLDEPRTPEELAADLDLTRTRADRTLEFMTDGGYAYEANGVYHADESQFGGVAFVRRTLGGAARRFLRPFRA